MGYKTPNIDRLAKEGMMFTDYYAKQELHGRPLVVYYRPVRPAHGHDHGLPGATLGLQKEED